jgi:hypothetical protein
MACSVRRGLVADVLQVVLYGAGRLEGSRRTAPV